MPLLTQQFRGCIPLSWRLTLAVHGARARSGNVPNQNLLSADSMDPMDGGGEDDAEVAKFRLLANAFRNNVVFVSVSTVVHPAGLLNGTSRMGAAHSDWPVPAW